MPLYLEFASDAVFDKPAAPTAAEAPSQNPPASDAQDTLEFVEPGEPRASSTLFIKGLAFGTTQASLQERCSKAAAAVGGLLRSVKMPTKKNAQGKELMQGYAFAEFSNHSTAKSVMHRMNGSHIDGHSVVVELSQRGGKESAQGIKVLLQSGGAMPACLTCHSQAARLHSCVFFLLALFCLLVHPTSACFMSTTGVCFLPVSACTAFGSPYMYLLCRVTSY